MTATSDLAWLGDAFDIRNPAGFAQAARRRATGSAPTDLIAAARRHGIALAYTPARWGGGLADPVRNGRLIRRVMSRDLDAMTALLMHLTPVLVTGLLGSVAQRERIVQRIVAGEDVGYALSERDHGADLLAMRTTAEEVDGDVVLTGGKWFVGLAPTATSFVVIARSGGHGPAAFSAYEVPADAPGLRIGVTHATDGFRGTRFADLELDRVRVPATARLGPRGAALEAVLRAQTVVRTLSLPGLLAGADADRMLLATFGDERRGGVCLRDDPLFCADAGEVAGAMLLAEVAAEEALDVLGSRTAAAAMPAALAKHVVVESVTTAHRGIDRLLASRGVLTDGVWGMHAKVVADARVIGAIDGSAVATLRSVAAFVPRCVAAAFDPAAIRPPHGSAHVDVSDFDPAQISVVPAGTDPALQAFIASGERVSSLPARRRVAQLQAALASHRDQVRRVDALPRTERPAALVDLARCHAWLSFAAAAVVRALEGRTGPLAAAIGECWLDAALDHALAQVRAGEMSDHRERARWGAALLAASTTEPTTEDDRDR